MHRDLPRHLALPGPADQQAAEAFARFRADPDVAEDPQVDAEFRGSLTICEDGALRPTFNQTGGVVDKFGVYRIPDEPDSTHPDFYRDSEPGRWG